MKRYFLFLFFMVVANPVNAISIDIFQDRTTFTSLIGSSPQQSIDYFSPTYPELSNMDNVEFLSGVSGTYNRGYLSVLSGGLFGYREQYLSSSIFEFTLDGSYNSFGFNINSFDPNTPGPVSFEMLFADGTIYQESFIPGNSLESESFFFGVISDTPLLALSYGEGPEVGGTSTGFFTRTNCCEETTLSHFIAASLTPVPEPDSLALLGIGLLLLGFSSMRKLAF